MFILLQVSFEITNSKGARQEIKITQRGVRKLFWGDTNQYIELSLQTDPPARKHNQVSIPNHQTTHKASQRHSGVTV